MYGRKVYVDTTEAPLTQETSARFWLPVSPGFTGSVLSGCEGYDFSQLGCGLTSFSNKRYGNAGIIVKGSLEAAASFAPNMDPADDQGIAVIRGYDFDTKKKGQVLRYWLRHVGISAPSFVGGARKWAVTRAGASLQVTATPGVGGHVEYSLENNFSAMFSISSSTGLVTAVRLPATSESGEYQVMPAAAIALRYELTMVPLAHCSGDGY